MVSLNTKIADQTLIETYSYDSQKILKSPITVISIGIFLLILITWFLLTVRYITKTEGIELTLLTGVIIIINLVFHELIHAGVGLVLGYTPSLKWHFFSHCYCLIKEKMEKRHFIIICAAPLVVLSIIYIILFFVIPFFGFFLFLCFFTNTIGSAGDILFIKKAIEFEGNCLINVDKAANIKIYSIS